MGHELPSSNLDGGGIQIMTAWLCAFFYNVSIIRIRIFTGDMSNDIHSPGPVIWGVSLLKA